MERFVGQVAVVTGAGGGISSAITKELLKKEVHVVGLDKNSEALKVLENEVLKDKCIYLGKFYPKVCDITVDEQVRKTFDWLKTKLKTFSILINGAGTVCETDHGLKSFHSSDFDHTFGVHVKGFLLCTKEALDFMSNSSITGHIINICSKSVDSNFLPGESFSIYKASKQAVKSFSNDLRYNISKKRGNIKITTVYPGVVRTRLQSPLIMTHATKQEIIEPEDVAKGCIAILDTPPNVLISEIAIEPIHVIDFQKFF